MSRPGRPLRVLAIAGLALPVWLVVQVPTLQRRHAEIMAALVPAEVAGLKGLRRPGPLAPDPVVLMAHMQPAVVRIERRPAVRRRREVETVSPTTVELIRIAAPSSDPIDRGPAAVQDPTAPAAARPFAATAFDMATRAYQRLAAGDRREANRLFAAALAEDADAPQAGQWAAERRRLNRRWSGDAFVLLRDAGAPGSAASPVLGGGQSAATLGYTLDPLALRPVAVFGRAYAAHDASGLIDGATAQAALGVRWQPLPGVSVAAERLVAVGRATSGDWNVRVAAGGERRTGPVTLDGYAEAGARGNGDLYAGGQAHAMLAVGRLGRVSVGAGPGAWGSVQSGGATVWRVDVGPGVAAALPGGVTARTEWRWRVAGNAAPGSGPAVTLGWSF